MNKETIPKNDDYCVFWGSFFCSDAAEKFFSYFKKPSLVKLKDIFFEDLKGKNFDNTFFIAINCSGKNKKSLILIGIKDYYIPELKTVFGNSLKPLKDIFLELFSSNQFIKTQYNCYLDNSLNLTEEELKRQIYLVLSFAVRVEDTIDCEFKFYIPHNYVCLMISSFFHNISEDLLKESSIEETMRKISTRFLASKDKPWNILDYLRRLRDYELQIFLYQLISSGLKDKELSLLLLPLEERIRRKVIINLSKNIQEEVLYNIPDISFTQLQAKQNKVLLEQYKKAFAKADSIILRLMNEGKLNLESLESFKQMKERFEIAKLHDFLLKNDLDGLLSKEYEPLTLQKALSEISSRDLALSMANIKKEALLNIKKNVSETFFKNIISDMQNVSQTIDQKDILKARAKLAKKIIKYCTTDYLKKAEKLLDFLIYYDQHGKIRKLLFKEIPMEFFARAFQNKEEVFFKKLLYACPDSRKKVFYSMLLQIRKTQNSIYHQRTSAEYI